MPTIVPSTTYPSLSRDICKQLVSNCLQMPGSVANFIEGMAGATPTSGKIHLFPDYLPDLPDFAGSVMARQDLDEDQEPVRSAVVTVVLRCANASASGTAFGAKEWAQAAAECVAQYTHPGDTGTVRVLDTLTSGRKVLSYSKARIMPAGEDGAKRYLVAVEFNIKFTDLNVS